MAATNMFSGTPTPAPASYVPTPADLDELHLVRAAHDLIDLAPGLPQELKWGLLDYVAGVLEGDRRAVSEPRRVA